MTTAARIHLRRQDGYATFFVVMFLLAFGSFAALHVYLVLAAGTTSRAWDSSRQGAAEMVRIERAVAETILALREVSAAAASNRTAQEELAWQLSQIDAGGATLAVASVTAPPVLPQHPDLVAIPALAAPSDELLRLAPAELRALAGNRVAESGDLTFRVTSRRRILENEYEFPTTVTARMVAVPLTRYAVAAYDLPHEIGTTPAVSGATKPTSQLPTGLVPSRDPAFIGGLRSGAALPYAYRRRASVAAAYQYVFSQAYIDRVAEYAGITHFCNLDAPGGTTAALAGMTVNAGGASWDLGVAGAGTYGTITLTSDAAVVFTSLGGKTMTLSDSVQSGGATPMLLVVAGPTNTGLGPLTVNVGNVARPILLVGYNIRVQAVGGTVFSGAMLLDPASTVPAGTGPLHVGHLSYYYGSTNVAATAIVADCVLPSSIPPLAPRVTYVATISQRL